MVANGKVVLTGGTGQDKLLRGANILASAVGSTMGPMGNTALIATEISVPIITKDGVTVAEHTHLTDEVENMAVQVIKQAAKNTADEAGDGTTTATVLAAAMFRLGLKDLNSKERYLKIPYFQGMRQAVADVTRELHAVSRKIETTEEAGQIATISANNDKEIGDLVRLALDNVGINGLITIEESHKDTDEVQFELGYDLGRAIYNKRLLHGETKVTLNNPELYLRTEKVDNVNLIIGIYEQCLANNHDAMLLAPEFSDMVIDTVALNNARTDRKVYLIQAPEYGNRMFDILHDLAIASGTDKPDSKPGKLAKVVISDKDTILYFSGEFQDQLHKRVETIKSELAEESDGFNKKKLQERIAKLNGVVAIIKVGGNSQAEVKEKIDRYDDSLKATRCAIEEGVVIGGGNAFMKISKKLNDKLVNDDQSLTSMSYRVGYKNVLEAIKTPFKTILSNAGHESVYYDVKSDTYFNNPDIGLDTITLEEINFIKAGIIDPVKVERVAVKNASSVAITLLTTKTIMYPENRLGSVEVNQMY